MLRPDPGAQLGFLDYPTMGVPGVDDVVLRDGGCFAVITASEAVRSERITVLFG